MRLASSLALVLGLAAGDLWGLWAPAETKQPVDGMKQVRRVALMVTDGQVNENKGGFLTIDAPEVRATQLARTSKGARLEFTYQGPSKKESKLASGDVVHQIGLKLRSKDTCNLLYVMWKLEEKERIAVSVKRNPGQSTHKECGANGYMNIAPDFAEKPENLPSGKDGKSHTLEATVSKKDKESYALVVKADGKEVWKGTIEAKVLDDIDGPPGFRTDNGVFTFKFYSDAK
jgi:hypothetical protein